MTPAPEALSLLEVPRRALWRAFEAGQPVAPEALAGRRYRGISLGLPAVVERLTWKTFCKAFARVEEEAGPRVVGWNERLIQTGLDGPLENLERRGEPVCFGHFEAIREREGGTLLHYGRGGNAPWDPAGLVRDPLVSLRPGSAEVLLGRTWLALGPFRLDTPSWFLLEHAGPLQRPPPRPPRRAPAPTAGPPGG